MLSTRRDNPSRPNRGCAVLFVLAAIAPAGCENVDWDHWDFAWWERPRRVVKPSETRRVAEAPDPSQERKAARTAPTGPADANDPGDRVTEGSEARTSTARPAASRRQVQNASLRKNRRPAKSGPQPYYHLYLLSDPSIEIDDRADAFVRLENIEARTCARILEMLYVPTGLSGSVTESYLFYAERGDFEAAHQFVAALDVKPDRLRTDVANPREAFDAGLTILPRIIEQGAIVDRKAIERGEQLLAEAGRSIRLSNLERWAAAVLAGRLASEYRYDYAGARSYYLQARRLSESGSIERMTVDWWIADAFLQQGNGRGAKEAYRELLAAFAEIRPLSQVVNRSRAMLKKYQDR